MAPRSHADVKTKLLTSALYLFNRFGFVNVRLQHIADEAEVSVGNLTYHFKTKDTLIESIYQLIIIAQEKLLSDLHRIPIFSTIDRHINATFFLQQQYSFFFTDTLEIIRALPTLKHNHRKHIEWQTMQITWLLKFNIGRNALRLPKAPDSVAMLAHRYIMLTETWINFERMRGVEAGELKVENYRLAVWALLSPYFTKQGMLEFQHLIPRTDLGE